MQTRADYNHSCSAVTSGLTQSLNSELEKRRVQTQTIWKSEEQFRLLADLASVLLWMSDAQGRCIFLNQQELKFNGRALGEDLEKGWIEGAHPEDLQHCLETYHQSQVARTPFELEYRLRYKNGEYRWIFETATPYWMPDGSFAGYVGTSVEIAQRKQLEEELHQYRSYLQQLQVIPNSAPIGPNPHAMIDRDPALAVHSESEEQFRAIFEQAAVGITNVSPNGQFLRVNQRFCEIVGYTVEELLSMNFQQLTYPEDLATNLIYRQACYAGELSTFSLEKRYICKDGSCVWVNLTVSVVRDDCNRPKYDIAVITDISDRKRAEVALKAEREQLFTLLDRLPAYVYLQAPDRSVQFANRYFRQHFGDPTTQSYSDLLSQRSVGRSPGPEDPTSPMEELKSTAVWEWTHTNNRTYQVHSFPFSDSDGQQLVLELGIDITARKQAEAALRQSQQMLQLVMDNIPQAIFWKDRQSVYLGCNRTGAIDAGLSCPEAIVGLTDYDLPWTPEQADLFRTSDLRVMESDRPEYHLLQLQRQAHGKWAWLDTNKIPLHGVDGSVVGILITYEDITERKQSEEAILEVAHRLATVIETVGEGITLSDETGHFVIFNSKMQEITGYSREEVEAAGDFLNLLYPDPQARASAWNGIDEILQKGGSRDIETAIATKDGKQKTLLVSTSLVQYRNRKLFLSAYRDISQRVEAQAALRQAEAKYRSLFENAIEGIFQTTAEGYYLNANPALARIYGYSSPQALMASLTNIEEQLYVDSSRRLAFIRQLQEHDAVSDFESQVYRADGSIIWISENARAVRSSSGELLYYEGTVEDITERKRLEEERRQQTERERLMGKITQRIRQFINLQDILDTTVAEVKKFLQTDRVLIYRFATEGNQVVAKSADSDWQSTPDADVLDACLAAETYRRGCQQDGVSGKENFYSPNLVLYYQDLLARFDVKAHLVVPIVLQGLNPEAATGEEMDRQAIESPLTLSSGPELWGLLVAYDCQEPRCWQPLEVDLLAQLATQLAIAIQQAELYQRLEDANRELKRLATLDGLTLIPNRRRFDEFLESAWQRSLREQTPLSLILCDVDFFKLYNDTYGHQAGDACLKKVAAALTHAVNRGLRRVEDGEGRGLEDDRQFLVARYGGEEFAIVLPNSHPIDAIRVARAIRSEMEALALPHAKSTVSNCVTVSLGISSTIAKNRNSVELIMAADRALYQAKERGRDRLEEFRI